MRTLRVMFVVVAVLALLSQIAVAAVTAAGRATDHELLIITGGSMEPKFSVGDAVWLDVSTGGDVPVGTIVTFKATGTGKLTTHRVISRHRVQGALHLRTQGDANDFADPDLVHAKAVVGVPVAHLPAAGYAASFLLTPMGRLVGYGPILLLILVGELRLLRAQLPGVGRHRGTARPGLRRRRSVGRHRLPAES